MNNDLHYGDENEIYQVTHSYFIEHGCVEWVAHYSAQAVVDMCVKQLAYFALDVTRESSKGEVEG